MFRPIHRVPVTLPAAAVPSLRPPPVRRAWPTCQFPLWPDGADVVHPDYGTMCGKPSLQNRSYCAEHHASCTARVPLEPPADAPGVDTRDAGGAAPLGEAAPTRGDGETEGAAMESKPIPGSGSFTVVLKASEADWVRASAAQRSTTPDELIRMLIAQARANDASKGGRLPAGLDLAERRRLAAGIGA